MKNSLALGGIAYEVRFVREDMVSVIISRDNKAFADECEMVVVHPLPEIGAVVSEESRSKIFSNSKISIEIDKDSGDFSIHSSSDGKVLQTASGPSWAAGRIAGKPEEEGETVYRRHMGNGQDGVVYENRPANKSSEHGVLCLELALKPDEHIYGFGMRASSPDAAGSAVDTWIDHFGADDYRTPFFWSSSGYSVFIRTAKRALFDVGAEVRDKLQIKAFNEDALQFFFQAGGVRECLEGYTWLTGRSPALPDWAFGSWLGGYWKTQKELMDTALELRRRKIPTDVMRLDSCWQGSDACGFHECDFRWDDNYPDAPGMIAELSSLGYKLHLWLAHVINYNCINFGQGIKEDVYLKNADGSIPLIKWWKVDRGAIIDFTKPGACDWWKSQIKPVLEQGVAGFKTDGANESYFVTGERLFADGRTGEEAHNVYPILYARCVTEAQQEVYGHYAPIWIRSGYAGIQRYPIMWAGDQNARWESILMQIRSGISAGLSGVAFWSSDGGGFAGKPDEALYIRGIQFAFWNPICQPFGRDREPWHYSEFACGVYKYYAELRNRLHPYIAGLAGQSVKTGLPMMRAMFVEFPDDPECYASDDQYMFGSAFLVAPVYKPEETRELYLPAGEWADLYTGGLIEGGRRISIRPDLGHIPVYVRCNVPIPVKEVTQYIGEKTGGSLSIYLWKGTNNTGYCLDFASGTAIDGLKAGDAEGMISFFSKKFPSMERRIKEGGALCK